MPYRLAYCWLCATAIFSLQARAEATLPTIQVQAFAPAETEDAPTYLGSAASSTATGLPLKVRQTPQPVHILPRRLLDDQDAQAVRDVAALSAGLTALPGQSCAPGWGRCSCAPGRIS